MTEIADGLLRDRGLRRSGLSSVLLEPHPPATIDMREDCAGRALPVGGRASRALLAATQAARRPKTYRGMERSTLPQKRVTTRRFSRRKRKALQK